jgi:AraC family transcriptional regulator
MAIEGAFDVSRTHQVLRRLGVPSKASSKALGWSSAFASLYRERPFDAHFEANPNNLIVWSRSGPAEVSYRIGGRVVPRQLQLRGLLFLPAGHSCDVTLHTPIDSMHLYLRPELFRSQEADASDFRSGLAPILGGDDGVLLSLLAVMNEMLQDAPGAVSSLLADSVAAAIAGRLVALNYQRAGSPNSPRRLGRHHVRKVREYVEANLTEDITLRELANLCGCSTAHFIRLFKATVGISPHQYVLGMRVCRAKALLDDSEHNLLAIARACGFSHPQQLVRTFRRLTGVTPGAHRRG